MAPKTNSKQSRTELWCGEERRNAMMETVKKFIARITGKERKERQTQEEIEMDVARLSMELSPPEIKKTGARSSDAELIGRHYARKSARR